MKPNVALDIHNKICYFTVADRQFALHGLTSQKELLRLNCRQLTLQIFQMKLAFKKLTVKDAILFILWSQAIAMFLDNKVMRNLRC